MPSPSPEFAASVGALLGDEFPAFLDALERPPALAMRVHRDCAAAREFAVEPVPWARDAFYLKPGARPGASIAHACGAFYLQEASAMLPAAALQAAPGELVLDLCAAPGGKSSQIARDLAGDGVLVANEIDPARARALAGNLERLGVPNALVVSETPARLAAKWPGMFDAVLVDAPCSGEGMFRRDPNARAEWSPEAPAGCARRQRQILSEAARLVRPGGRLVYSTCTFNALENEGTVEAFLGARPDFSPRDFEIPGVGTSEHGMLRLWPHRARGDGHFAALFQKAGDAPMKEALRAQAPPRALLEAFVRALPPLCAEFRKIGNCLAAVPAGAPDASGLKVVSPGLRLLRFEKNRAEPEHALAMALSPGMARREAALSEGEARAFLEGQSIPRAGEPGWALALFEGLPLGWAKLVDGVLKNHLPKGLRRSLTNSAPSAIIPA
ncbi:MAG: SAM-dependent methyltransferase [Clostridiales bacterium]|nr:SAM-dependent methyltransferase [Clostridiales bacterium]